MRRGLQLPLSIPGNVRPYSRAEDRTMLRRSAYTLLTVSAFLSMVPAANCRQAAATAAPAKATAAAAPQVLKEKIAFVRADPSEGVASMRSVTDANDQTGRASGMGVYDSHETPDMEATTAANPKTSQIGIMNPDGSGATTLRVYGSDPNLSPDGARIVYCSSRDNIYSQIYTMNADGSNSKRITNISTGDACGPAFGSRRMARRSPSMLSP